MLYPVVKQMNNDYTDYLRDESRKTGYAETISFPTSEEEISLLLAEASRQKKIVTMQGARTGITAGAVPFGGQILNLEKMNRIKALSCDAESGLFYLTVEPGLRLCELRKSLDCLDFDVSRWDRESISALSHLKKSDKYFFSPDPTEASASIGGMAACNASGARSYLYGPVRKYIQALRVVLPDGSVAALERGKERASGFDFIIKTESGKIITGTIPQYKMPQVKNASGYYSKRNMDLIDLFIGSEGTLGVITELKLKLLKHPGSVWGILFFFSDEYAALNFVVDLRSSMPVAAIEFFNHNVIKLFREVGQINTSFRFQEIPSGCNTAIYVELHGSSEDEVSGLAESCACMFEKNGGNSECAWVAANSRDMELFHAFRHWTPETVNRIIDQRRQLCPDLTKLGTDMAVPDDELIPMMEEYNRDLEASGLESVIFGHIGNNHVHVNILPLNMEDYRRGKELYQNWAEKVISLGGTISAEHGVGKLKKTLLSDMFGENGIMEMKTLKHSFDPDGILNRGNLFDL